MKKKIFVFFLLIASITLNVAFSAHAEPTNHASATLTNTKQIAPITITSPHAELPISGTFYIKGTAQNTSDSVERITVTLTSLYDRKQEVIKQYEAAFDKNTQVWNTKVPSGELAEGMYIIQVEVQDRFKGPQYTFSSFILAPESQAMNTI